MLSKEQILTNLKAVMRQAVMLGHMNRKTGILQAKSSSKIEYDSYIKLLVFNYGLTPEQIAEELKHVNR